MVGSAVWSCRRDWIAPARAIAPAHAPNAVCAAVKIKQKLSVERQAFDAVMRINNGLQTNAMQNASTGHAVVANSDSSNICASSFLSVGS
jgi:hypothetical protein